MTLRENDEDNDTNTVRTIFHFLILNNNTFSYYIIIIRTLYTDKNKSTFSDFDLFQNLMSITRMLLHFQYTLL